MFAALQHDAQPRCAPPHQQVTALPAALFNVSVCHRLVAHGYLIVLRAAGLFVDPAPGPVLANYGVDNLRFLTPVKVGDSITVQLTCKDKKPRPKEGYGEVRWDAVVRNQDGRVVASYDVLTLVAI